MEGTEETDGPPTGSRSELGGAPSDQTDPVPSSDSSGRYAVYDLRYLRFVGEVSDKRPSKTDARKVAGHDDVEVREV